MSDFIRQDLQATGVAPVICVLKAPERGAAASTSARDLSQFFVSSELSQESALATAAAGELESARRMTDGAARGRRAMPKRPSAQQPPSRHDRPSYNGRFPRASRRRSSATTRISASPSGT